MKNSKSNPVVAGIAIAILNGVGLVWITGILLLFVRASSVVIDFIGGDPEFIMGLMWPLTGLCAIMWVPALIVLLDFRAEEKRQNEQHEEQQEEIYQELLKDQKFVEQIRQEQQKKLAEKLKDPGGLLQVKARLRFEEELRSKIEDKAILRLIKEIRHEVEQNLREQIRQVIREEKKQD